MKFMHVLLLIVIGVSLTQRASAELVQVDITGNLLWYYPDNQFGIDSMTTVGGYLIYDDQVAQTDGTYFYTNYSDWSFLFNVDNLTKTEQDATYNMIYRTQGISITFENGAITGLYFRAVEGASSDPDALLMVQYDWGNQYPGYDFFFELSDYVNLIGPVAVGGLELSGPHSVTAVPLPAPILLFLSGISFFALSLRRKISI